MASASEPQPPRAESADPAAEPDKAVGTPLCFVVDEEPSIRHFVSLILHGLGIDTMEFADGSALRKSRGGRPPNLVFHNISLESADAIESVVALGKNGFRGAVQLMSNRGSAVLEHVKNIGVQHQLNMLPVLKKPFETEAIVKIMQDLKLGFPAPAAARVELSEALAKNWVEFWYQPKINLRKKQLHGAETFARVQHPQHGILLPAAFMTGASEADLVKLSELTVKNGLDAGIKFAKLGINLRIDVNIPLAALVRLPLAELIKAQRPDPEKWPGMIVGVTEEQIIKDLPLAAELKKKFGPLNVHLAVDDFGRACNALNRVKELPFAELKIDRAFVLDCGTSKVNAPVCKTVIDLAHNFGSAAVAVGIEKASDAMALVSMGCDYGQGFLLGQPMPEDRFAALLRQRSGTDRKAPEPTAA